MFPQNHEEATVNQPAIIFDFGNVIAYFDFEKATTRLGAQLGLSGEELLDRLGAAGFREVLQRYERGELSSTAFSREISNLISLKITHDEFAAAWGAIFTANESIIPVVESLKRQGFRLILGSNTNHLHAVKFRDQFASTLAHFDHLVLSYEVRQIKPHRDFYLACAAAAERPPADCVFIDDLAENIAGAQGAGLIGVLYESTPQLISDLAQLGVQAS